MFSKAMILVAASFALLTAATPVPDNTDSCNTGDMQCCNSVHETNSDIGKTIISLLTLDVTGLPGRSVLPVAPSPLSVSLVVPAAPSNLSAAATTTSAILLFISIQGLSI
ncbi:hypothetical protein BD779DRAFT_1709462 [Infundibulicybe gibba]|nr:hypothetical protein BD779DRAFT_1709462 [Infundibulicybe gibba]